MPPALKLFLKFRDCVFLNNSSMLSSCTPKFEQQCGKELDGWESKTDFNFQLDCRLSARTQQAIFVLNKVEDKRKGTKGGQEGKKRDRKEHFTKNA